MTDLRVCIMLALLSRSLELPKDLYRCEQKTSTKEKKKKRKKKKKKKKEKKTVVTYLGQCGSYPRYCAPALYNQSLAI